MHGWVKRYLEEMPPARPSASDSQGELSQSEPIVVSKLHEKKRGRPLLVGEEIEAQIWEFIRETRASGRVVNTCVTLAAVTGIVMAKDANIWRLPEFDKGLDQTTDDQNGFIKPPLQLKFMLRILKNQKIVSTDLKTISKFEAMPKEIVINWGQTAVKYVPESN